MTNTKLLAEWQFTMQIFCRRTAETESMPVCILHTYLLLIQQICLNDDGVIDQ